MKKGGINIAKEIFIIIILMILIMLILAVALYDFIPNDVQVAKPIEYAADSETTTVKQEIAYTNGGDSTADESTQQEMVTSLKSYSVEATDLTVYGEKNLYVKGNSNPFDYAEEASAEGQPENNAGENNTANTTTQTNTTNATQTTNTQTTASPANNTASGNNSNGGTFFESPSSK